MVSDIASEEQRNVIMCCSRSERKLVHGSRDAKVGCLEEGRKDVGESIGIGGAADDVGVILAGTTLAEWRCRRWEPEGKEWDGMDFEVVDGGAVAVPDGIDEVVGVEEGVEGSGIEANFIGGVDDGGSMGGGLPLFKMLPSEGVHEEFLLPETSGPEHRSLRIDGLPLSLDTVIKLNANFFAQVPHLGLGTSSSVFRSAVAQQSVVPGRLLALGSAIPGHHAVLRRAIKRVRMAPD